jgi:hypothetical protein
MRKIAWVVVAAVAFSSVACRKPKPSPEYAKASGSYTSLLAQLGDDAYADPAMAEIERLLDKVPPSSLDAAAAAELKTKIASERKRVLEEAAARARTLENALKPPAVADLPRDTTPEPTNEPQAQDAGPPKLAAGMSLDDARKLTQDCIEFAEDMKLRDGSGKETDAAMWQLKDLGRCRDAQKEHLNHVIVFQGGKLVGVFDKSAIQRVPVAAPAPPPGSPAPAAGPDAG